MYARSKTEAGFTIVETLIFLAISGLMFVLAINATTGQQQKTEFTTAVSTLKSQLNHELSNVADGNYDLPDFVNCSANNPGDIPQFAASSAPDGTCTLIGEIISFGGVPAGSPEVNYYVYPIIGLNYTSLNQPATNLSEAFPQIYSTEYRTYTMPYGLNISSNVTTTTVSPSTNGAFGLVNFTSFQGGTSTAGSQLSNGAQHVELFVLPNSQLADPPATIVGIVDGNQVPPSSGGTGLANCSATTVCAGGISENINPSPQGITFCVNSGTDSESAMFTIGGTNGNASVYDQIYSQLDCTDA